MIASNLPVQDRDNLAIVKFRPRPDQPDRFDQQESFWKSQHPGVTFLVGGNGAGTTEVALSKVVHFLFTTPPPRRDTPFWIIAGSYEQVMSACWKEKLFGHGHIPAEEVDWDRVRWYSSKDFWPYSVPLRDHPDTPGRNWVLEFKSYEQGRQQMQARSIGGFLFSEQFPWSLLEEVLRGCREYSFVGNKLCEFTPIDPELTVRLQEMMEEDKLPPGWAVYRANTECALEAGHVSKQWFDTFFGTDESDGVVSEEMRMTRMTGAWATFEGLIYQGFNPLVHFVDDDYVFPGGDFPDGVYHRRAIDWGAGPDNAFAAVWAYIRSDGQYVVYDEYNSTDQTKTVHEHLAAIADRWPWPAKNPYYGTTYADPSDIDNIRIASRLSHYMPGYEDFNISGANNRVLEGIDHVRYMLKRNPATNKPRLVIHKKNCPNLAREIQIYRWLKSSGQGINPRDARPEPLKKDDHQVDALRYLLFTEATVRGTTAESIARDHSRESIRLDKPRGRRGRRR